MKTPPVFQIEKSSLPMIQEFVKLEPETHRYYDTNGKEYTSVSRVLSSITKPFDANRMAGYTAIKRGIPKEQIMAEWAEMSHTAIDFGTRFHLAMDGYAKTNKVVRANKDINPVVKALGKEYTKYQNAYEEVCLYDQDYSIAGTADKILVPNDLPSAPVDIDDFKTNKEIAFFSKYKEYFHPPLAHLQNCHYNKYALQLSAYAYMVQKLHKKRIGRLRIIWIARDGTFQAIPVPYMRYEIAELFKNFAQARIPTKSWLDD